MKRNAILQKVTELLREILDDQTVLLRDTTVAQDVAGWDSFNNINLMIAIEKSLGVHFRTHEIEDLRNVGELLDMI